ncbi:alpha-ribazole kinase [Orenia metallireducens]|uniref:Alpha-ribazole kinase n=1 Tax=Orenia metallireducens TaxID=1413210 RepID=A0A285GPF4_9FIRM|nr:AIR synthase related protein [Orenia metallireducens]PRX29861.1 alpha-ribazole kinase [Orenia metallireducens]SNY25365.1 alpha-ribazole kinase [Orenia metallireducens]
MKRDISIVNLDSEKALVIACDSLGGIGSKKHDKIRVANSLVGKFTARVALMELMASGATPISVVDTLSVELKPTGEEIISGIKEEIAKIGIDDLLTGSTEENVVTVQTGIGVTAIGSVEIDQLRVGSSQQEDLIVAIGLPKVGDQVLADLSQIADLDLLIELLKFDYIHEILPVGSKGILYEAQLLAKSNGLELSLVKSKVDLQKSAGPATVLLVTVAAEDLTRLKVIDKPVNVIGRLD